MRRSRPTACERQSRQGKKSGLKSSRHPQKVLKRPGQQAAERGPRAAEQHHGPPAAARFGQRAGHCVELAGHALDNGRQALDLLGLAFDLGLQHRNGDVSLAQLFLVQFAHSLAASMNRLSMSVEDRPSAGASGFVRSNVPAASHAICTARGAFWMARFAAPSLPAASRASMPARHADRHCACWEFVPFESHRIDCVFHVKPPSAPAAPFAAATPAALAAAAPSSMCLSMMLLSELLNWRRGRITDGWLIRNIPSFLPCQEINPVTVSFVDWDKCTIAGTNDAIGC